VLRSARGFVQHTSYPIDGSWRVLEIRATREDAARFYATTIAPHLPEGIHPKTDVYAAG
jgi:hypothetical protein